MESIRSINKHLLPLKIFYFLFFGGTAPVLPYLTVKATQLGINSFGVGVIWGFTPVAVLVGKIIFGYVADKWKLRKTLFIWSTALVAIFMFLPQFAPAVPLPYGSRLDLICNGSTRGYLQQCSSSCVDSLNLPINRTCDLRCYSPCSSTVTVSVDAVDLSLESASEDEDCVRAQLNGSFVNATSHLCSPNCTATCELSGCQGMGDPLSSCILEEDSYWSYSAGRVEFWLFAFIILLSYGVQATSLTLADTVTFQLLGARAQDYGYTRMFGSLGWGSIAVVSALVKNAEYASYFLLVFLLAAALSASFVRVEYHERSAHSNVRVREVVGLILQPRVVAFLCAVVVVGMMTALQWNFFFIHLYSLMQDYYGEEEGIDNSRSILLSALLMCVQTFLGELPFFFLSGRMIKLLGFVNTFTLIQVVFGVRFVLYSVLRNPWLFLPVEVLQGLTFGLFYAAMASYAHKIAPSKLGATLQGITGAVFESVGVGFGSFIGGKMGQDSGLSMAFLIFSFISFAGAFLFRVVSWGIDILSPVVPDPTIGDDSDHELHDRRDSPTPIISPPVIPIPVTPTSDPEKEDKRPSDREPKNPVFKVSDEHVFKE